MDSSNLTPKIPIVTDPPQTLEIEAHTLQDFPSSSSPSPAKSQGNFNSESSSYNTLVENTASPPTTSPFQGNFPSPSSLLISASLNLTSLPTTQCLPPPRLPTNFVNTFPYKLT